MSQPDAVIVVHYSCESFFDRPNGSSPRITSIAARNLESGQTYSFSIHQMAEVGGVSLDCIGSEYDRLEKQMLDAFYEYASTHPGRKWLHWNMRDVHYGFQAIAHRHKVLKGKPVDIPEGDRVDLSDLIADIYGNDYISHPHLVSLVGRNNITDREFLAGADEATAFEKGEYVKLHFSTLRKVRVLAQIARLADDGLLRTDTTWKDRFRLYPQAFAEWLNEYWPVSLVIILISLVSGLIQIVNAIFGGE